MYTGQGIIGQGETTDASQGNVPLIQSFARFEPIHTSAVFTGAQGGLKIDLDDGADPARFDRVNWTATNWEIDQMIAKIAFTRELCPKKFDLAVDMHATL